MAKTLVAVICNARAHRVVVGRRGALAFIDHDAADLARERVLVGMGGPPCGCLRLLQRWRHLVRATFHMHGLPQELDQHLSVARSKHLSRQRTGDTVTVPALHTTGTTTGSTDGNWFIDYGNGTSFTYYHTFERF